MVNLFLIHTIHTVLILITAILKIYWNQKKYQATIYMIAIQKNNLTILLILNMNGNFHSAIRQD